MHTPKWILHMQIMKFVTWTVSSYDSSAFVLIFFSRKLTTSCSFKPALAAYQPAKQNFLIFSLGLLVFQNQHLTYRKSNKKVIHNGEMDSIMSLKV